jgi:hypothetical protein
MNDLYQRATRSLALLAFGVAALTASIGCGPGSGGDRCGMCLDGCMNSPDPDGCVDFCAKGPCRAEASARAQARGAAPMREQVVEQPDAKGEEKARPEEAPGSK